MPISGVFMKTKFSKAVEMSETQEKGFLLLLKIKFLVLLGGGLLNTNMLAFKLWASFCGASFEFDSLF